MPDMLVICPWLCHELKPCQFQRVKFRLLLGLDVSGHEMYYSGHMESRHETDMESRLATNIREAMAQEGLTTAELARRLEDHERQVRRWRNGETVPTFENVTKLAFELNRDPGWFYTDHNEKAAA